MLIGGPAQSFTMVRSLERAGNRRVILCSRRRAPASSAEEHPWPPPAQGTKSSLRLYLQVTACLPLDIPPSKVSGYSANDHLIISKLLSLLCMTHRNQVELRWRNISSKRPSGQSRGRKR